jgi:hypothetical protein
MQAPWTAVWLLSSIRRWRTDEVEAPNLYRKITELVSQMVYPIPRF